METISAVLLVILGTAAGLLIGRLIIRPMIERRAYNRKSKKGKKNKK